MPTLTRLTLVVLLVLTPAIALAGDEEAGAKIADRAERFIELYDADGDGKLSRAEYPELFRSLFDAADKDGDGYVTAAEEVAGRKALRAAPPRRRVAGRGRLPAGVRAVRDLVYAEIDGQKLRLDLYLPEKKEGKPPLFVWIHGGGWTKGSKAGVNPMVLRLVGEGYAGASIDYRLDGLGSHPRQIHDCKGAIRWLRAHAEKYGYDPGRMAVGGGSAGGHLSLLLGLSSGIDALEGTVGGHADLATDVRAIVDLYGPSDLLLFRKESKRFGRGVADERLKSASPLTYLDAKDPPILILHGDRDPLVPLSQSRELVRRCKEVQVPCALHVIEGAGHGGRPFSDDTRYQLFKAFLDRHLKAVVTTPSVGETPMEMGAE